MFKNVTLQKKLVRINFFNFNRFCNNLVRNYKSKGLKYEFLIIKRKFSNKEDLS